MISRFGKKEKREPTLFDRRKASIAGIFDALSECSNFRNAQTQAESLFA